MSDWMRRRIERSRARCEKSATNHKPDRRQEPAKQPNAQTVQAPAPEQSS
jgi:hypothetical protein